MFNLRQATDYLLYRLRAKTRHGTHSPFVYRLVDKVIYDYSAKKVYAEVEENCKEITAARQGATISPRVAQLIYRLVADWQPKNIVEVGRGEDSVTRYLQKNAPKEAVYSIADTAQFVNITKDLNQLDCVFIRKDQPVIECLEMCLPKAHDHTMLIIEGIYSNANTKANWTKIKADPRVTVTIDLFYIGLVYFRKGQVKEDFTIRF